MDPTLARTLMENLVDNAWKFTRQTRTARVEVGTTEVGGAPAFFVRDNGAASTWRAPASCSRRSSASHSEDEFPGTGIGLATCHRIVDRHGGRIWAEGRVGEGATIFFTLPPSGA